MSEWFTLTNDTCSTSVINENNGEMENNMLFDGTYVYSGLLVFVFSLSFFVNI